MPKAGFFLWLPIGDMYGRDDKLFALRLYKEKGIKSVPGSFMAVPTEAGHPGAGFVRLAIVHPHDIIKDLAIRLSHFMEKNTTHHGT